MTCSDSVPVTFEVDGSMGSLKTFKGSPMDFLETNMQISAAISKFSTD